VRFLFNDYMKNTVLTIATIILGVTFFVSCSDNSTAVVNKIKEFNSVATNAVQDSVLDDTEVQKLDALLAELNTYGEDTEAFEKTINKDENKAIYDEMNTLVIRLFSCDGSDKLKNLQ